MINGVIVDLITPTQSSGAPDYETVEVLVDWHVDNGSSALLIGSSTGQPSTMDIDERTELLRRALWQADGRIPIIADLGGDSADHAAELASIANEYGASAVLISAPTKEGAMSKNALLKHFASLAEAAQLPTLARAELNHANILSPIGIAELALISGIEGFVDGSTKATSSQELLKLKLPKGFALYAGHDTSAYQQMLAGYQGCISVSANVNPSLLLKLYALAKAGNSVDAEALDTHLQALHLALLEDPNSIPVKWALVEMGCIPEGEHPPALPQASDYSNLRRALRAAEIPV